MSTSAVRLYWRPGCPFCSRLRGDLDRMGLTREEINIWDDPSAAATVRSVAHGNETVPTVMVGNRAMVNPSATQVLDAVKDHAPDLLQGMDLERATRSAQGPWWAAALVPILAALVWFGLATGNPATTYHIAPMVVAAAWPIARRWRCGRALTYRTALGTAAGGIAVASIVTVLLSARHALAGPTITTSGSVVTETLLAVAAGAVIGIVASVARGRRSCS